MSGQAVALSGPCGSPLPAPVSTPELLLDLVFGFTVTRITGLVGLLRFEGRRGRV